MFLLTLIASVIATPTCQIVVPPFPLTYSGLITPYQLQGCDMRSAPSFVEAVILDLDTHSLSIYHPLLINAGSTPLSPPTPFTMPQNYIVGVWFGSNANAIALTPLANTQQCVYNIGGPNSQDTFGQFAHCGAVEFFDTIKKLILNNIPLNPPIPELGIALDGENCLTTRDFALVDMDPADNVVTTYLIDMDTGRTAQNSANNQAANPNAVVLKNGSDNLLLANLDAVMGCKPYRAPNLVDLNNPVTGGKISSMALDEIHAAVRQEKFYAYLPKGDPMVRVNGLPSIAKLNAYRRGVFQPLVNDLAMAGTTEFCAHFTNIQLPRLQKNKDLFIVQPSPDAAISTNLFGFLMNRFSTSFTGLNCNILLDLPNPVNLVMNNNLVTDAMITTVPTITTNPNDPYLLSWDDYPEFAEPTTPPPTTHAPTPEPTTPPPTTHAPTPEPTTPPPTTHAPTPEPTTHTPTTLSPTRTPTPDAIPDPPTQTPTVPPNASGTTIVILLSVVGAALVVGICLCMNKASSTQPHYIAMESVRTA
jgi:hypothetical protein